MIRSVLRPSLIKSLLVVLSIEGSAAPTRAQEDANAFYAGKTINIVVGFGPGGGYDLYARLLARFLGNHIPGHPSVVVQNMEGAGGVRAANHVYATAPRDGTVIAGVNQGATMFQQLGGKGAQYDPSRFNWIGRLGSSNNTVYTWSASGVRTIEDAKARDVLMAGSGVISDANIYPLILNALVGTRFKIINGYAGTNESNLALERGEVEGRGGGAYSSLVSTRPQWLRNKSISILAQIGFEKEPDLPTIPRLLDLVANDEDRQIATLVTLPVAIGYNYWFAPDVPSDRIALLRKAFDQAAHDPALLSAAQSETLEVRYKSGVELASMVSDASATPVPILRRAASILGW